MQKAMTRSKEAGDGGDVARRRTGKLEKDIVNMDKTQSEIRKKSQRAEWLRADGKDGGARRGERCNLVVAEEGRRATLLDREIVHRKN